MKATVRSLWNAAPGMLLPCRFPPAHPPPPFFLSRHRITGVHQRRSSACSPPPVLRKTVQASSRAHVQTFPAAYLSPCAALHYPGCTRKRHTMLSLQHRLRYHDAPFPIMHRVLRGKDANAPHRPKPRAKRSDTIGLPRSRRFGPCTPPDADFPGRPSRTGGHNLPQSLHSRPHESALPEKVSEPATLPLKKRERCPIVPLRPDAGRFRPQKSPSFLPTPTFPDHAPRAPGEGCKHSAPAEAIGRSVPIPSACRGAGESPVHSPDADFPGSSSSTEVTTRLSRPTPGRTEAPCPKKSPNLPHFR